MPFAFLTMSGWSMSLNIVVGIMSWRMTVRGTMRLVKLLGFFPIMTLAGNEGHGRKNKEHRDNFHRAPSIPC
jgi:hypothetical protein